MISSKHYSVDVSSNDDWSESPEVAKFSIEEETAREIIKLAKLVSDNGLHKVEKFDYRVTYLLIKPDDLDDEEEEEAGGEDLEPSAALEQLASFVDSSNQARTDIDCINVSSDQFWFSACTKHSSNAFATERNSIKELAEHFGLDLLHLSVEAKPASA